MGNIIGCSRQKTEQIFNESGIQESDFRIQNKEPGKSVFSILPKGSSQRIEAQFDTCPSRLAYGNASVPTRLIEDAGKLFEAFFRAILNSVYLSG
jgi:hypothetical protein